MPTKKKSASKRELIEPHEGDKRYVRRKAEGTFGKTVDVANRFPSTNVTEAKTKVLKDPGDRAIGRNAELDAAFPPLDTMHSGQFASCGPRFQQ